MRTIGIDIRGGLEDAGICAVEWYPGWAMVDYAGGPQHLNGWDVDSEAAVTQFAFGGESVSISGVGPAFERVRDQILSPPECATLASWWMGGGEVDLDALVAGLGFNLQGTCGEQPAAVEARSALLAGVAAGIEGRLQSESVTRDAVREHENLFRAFLSALDARVFCLGMDPSPAVLKGLIGGVIELDEDAV